jgi:hypothetical protein
VDYQELIERLRDTNKHTFALWFDAADAIESLLAENERLKAELAKYRDASLLKEVYLINDAYVRIRSERLFAIDDLEYDLFSAGWKAAVDLIVKPDENQ